MKESRDFARVNNVSKFNRMRKIELVIALENLGVKVGPKKSNNKNNQKMSATYTNINVNLTKIFPMHKSLFNKCKLSQWSKPGLATYMCNFENSNITLGSNNSTSKVVDYLNKIRHVV